jgi:hypothetical protein
MTSVLRLLGTQYPILYTVPYMIRYLTNTQIDKIRWDECIIHSTMPLVYVQSWYLDIVSPGWAALVEDDYLSVMPLPGKQKYMMPYLIQPKFTQQLGIFSRYKPTTDKVHRFMRGIPRKFVWQDFNLNTENILRGVPGTVHRVNYELDLRPSYTAIYNHYHQNTRRNIKKARLAEITISMSNLTDEFISLYGQFAKIKPDEVSLLQLKEVITQAINHNCSKLILARNKAGETISGAFFLCQAQRIIYLTSFNTLEGQGCAAMFLVMDEIIKQSASQPAILDFEGSMVPTIARFFAGFGAIAKPYVRFRNRLARLVPTG